MKDDINGRTRAAGKGGGGPGKVVGEAYGEGKEFERVGSTRAGEKSESNVGGEASFRTSPCTL